MYKHVTNYEEAKAYLQKDIDGAFDQRLKRAMLVKGIVSGSPVIIFGLLVAFLYKSPLIFVAAFVIAAGIFAASFFTSFRSRQLIKEEIISGEFFEKHNQMEIIAQANDQIDIHNQMFAKGQIK